MDSKDGMIRAEEQERSTNSIVVSGEKPGDDLERFTATGRPMKDYKSTMAYDNIIAAGGFTAPAASFLPTKFTDDSLISVPIPVEASADEDEDDDDEQLKGPVKGADDHPSVASKLKGKLMGNSTKKKKKGTEVKIVRMTRGDYLKYWARDEHGRYLGTEPEHLGPELWKEELAKPPRKGERPRLAEVLTWDKMIQ